MRSPADSETALLVSHQGAVVADCSSDFTFSCTRAWEVAVGRHEQKCCGLMEILVISLLRLARAAGPAGLEEVSQLATSKVSFPEELMGVLSWSESQQL